MKDIVLTQMNTNRQRTRVTIDYLIFYKLLRTFQVCPLMKRISFLRLGQVMSQDILTLMLVAG